MTDGNETCGGDPVAVAQQMRALGINVRVHVVGFGVSANEGLQLAAIAQGGGGTFASAENTEELSKALTKVVEVTTRKNTSYFTDEFDGDDLGEHWNVVNADEDLYIVEDGKLLAVAASAGSLQEETVENVFTLNHPLPKGDWVATMKFNLDVQTSAECVFFGLYDDKDNHTTGGMYFVTTWGGELRMNLSGAKMSRGKENSLLRERVWWGANGGPAVEQAKTMPKPLYLRIEKRGRSYQLAARLGDEASQAEWLDIGKLTALRAKGKLAFGITQYKDVPGESSMEVDSIKIEAIQ